MLVKVFRGGGGAEGFHADEEAVRADIAVPAEAGGGFDADAQGGAVA